MFRNAGSNRTTRQNALVAGYLALVAGYVNSAGFVVVGAFTSHATGNVGRFAYELAAQRPLAAAAALLLVLAFFVGAFAASVLIESSFFSRATSAYGVALALEAALLGLFVALGSTDADRRPGLGNAEAAMLGVAMGMQNSLVTRLSGAVVRTTHLTGVVTDLGIEAARWFRWWRTALAARLHVRLALGARPADRPSGPKVALLGTIAASFTLGAVVGSFAGSAYGDVAMMAPTLALAAGAGYAFATREARASVPPSGAS